MSFVHAPLQRADGIRVFPRPRLNAVQSERRQNVRYPFTAQAQCILAGIQTEARTRDISSGGVFLKTEAILRVGESIEVLIDWPVLLDQRCPLRLLILGKVLRSDGSGSAVGIIRYEFRIRPTRRLAGLSA